MGGRRTLGVGLTGLLALLGAAACGEDAPPPPAEPADYASPELWLCRPGQDDACSVELATTAVAADGTLTREPFEPLADPPIDCFYVYPTASEDEASNSDLVPGDEERAVIAEQFARFASRCRVFAPVYRQATLTFLRASLMGGAEEPADEALARADVRDAWRHYLEHDNGGRGFVLFGHSQGAGILRELIQSEIDGQPLQRQLVSAVLLGIPLAVPEGADVGGDFAEIPLCRSADQTGCAISYMSFRDSAPPSGSYGIETGSGQVNACTNPAALAGGRGELDPIFATEPSVATLAEVEWVQGARVETPFVRLPGLVQAECATSAGARYLAVSVRPDAEDPRADDIPGDVIDPLGRPILLFGLHPVDPQLSLGNLLEVVAQQTRAYLAAASSE